MYLLSGLKTKRCFKRSRASSEAIGNIELKVFFFGMFVLDMIFAARGDSIASISFWDGLPTSSKIFSIWFRVEFPGKIDFPLINYPKIQPTDHMSTAFEYLVDPKRISGALYHRVATYYVRTCSPFSLGQLIDLANPKSATLAWHSELSKMLLGLRSLWISSPECIYLSDFRSW